jgi:hypothetical protein
LSVAFLVRRTFIGKCWLWEWAQVISERQQNVLDGIDAYLTPAQIETLKALGAYDLAERQKQMMIKRKSLGIK